MTQQWTAQDIPDQTGRRVIITGGNSGIGLPAALELALHGASVVIAARDRIKGEAAVARIQRASPSGSVEFAPLDLASLSSVHSFADHELALKLPLDLLINNAGVYAPPKRSETQDGFELQFGTNVLGHFALTALLMPALERAAVSADLPPRIVMLASIAHKVGALNFADLQFHAYSAAKAYQQSKLADLMLSFELDRRLRAAGSRIISVAAHPGLANTNIFKVGDFGKTQKAIRDWVGQAIGLIMNSDVEGALPTLYAAVAAEATSGGYYGPQGIWEARGGDVGPARIASQARDEVAARRLWQICEDLTSTQML